MDLRLLIVLLVRQDPSTKKRSNPPDVAVFVCLSLLVRAVGRSHLTNEMKDLLDPMLAVGLSPALTTCLRELATSIPVLKRDIAEGLLKMLSLVLMHQPLRHPGNDYFIIISLLFHYYFRPFLGVMTSPDASWNRASLPCKPARQQCQAMKY